MIDKLRSLSRDTLIYGTNTIIGRFLNFILVPFYTNKFLPSEFGIVALLYSYIAILNVVFSIGLESGYMRFASTNEAGSKKQNFSNPFLIVLFNAFFLSLIIFVFSAHLSELFQIDERHIVLIKYSALILFLDTIVLIPFAYLRLNNRPKSFAGIKIISIVINVALNIVLISYFNFGIEAVFISNIAASGVTLLMLIPVVMRNMTLTFNKELVNELLRFSLPYIPAGISANIVQIIDRPILKYLTGDKEVGIYQANYRLGIFMMLIVAMFEFAWRPFFLNNAKDPDAKNIFSKVLTLFVAGSTLVFLLITVLIENVVKISLPFGFTLIGKDYWSGLSIVPVILFAYLLNGMYVNFTAGIYIEKKTKYLPLITGIGAASNIAANFLLIPIYSYMGAAIATLVSYFLMMIGIYYFSNKYYPVNYEYRKIGMAFVLLFTVTVLYFVINGISEIPWYLKIVFPAVYVFLLHVFKVFSLSSVRKLFS